MPVVMAQRATGRWEKQRARETRERSGDARPANGPAMIYIGPMTSLGTLLHTCLPIENCMNRCFFFRTRSDEVDGRSKLTSWSSPNGSPFPSSTETTRSTRICSFPFCNNTNYHRFEITRSIITILNKIMNLILYRHFTLR